MQHVHKIATGFRMIGRWLLYFVTFFMSVRGVERI